MRMAMRSHEKEFNLMGLTFLLFHLLLLVDQARAIPVASIFSRKPPPPAPSSSTTTLLVPWIQSRSASTTSMNQFTHDGQPASLWLYQGSLVDPATGRVLANVEGFEVIQLRALWQNATTTRTSSSVETDLTRFLQKLPAHNPVTNWTRTLLQRQNAKQQTKQTATDPPTMQAAAVWESRKVFLYRDEGNDLLTSIRLRPTGPRRKVPLSQAIATWHSTNMVLQPNPEHEPSDGSDKSNNKDSNPSFFFGTALRTSSSPRSSTLIWNTAPVTWDEDASDTTVATVKRSQTPQPASAAGNLEFTIHARPRRSSQSQDEAMRRHVAQQQHGSKGLLPPRAALVSLGGNESPHTGASAHETYRYSFAKERHGSVWYSRLGEGPVWYGPQMCRMELRGQRIDDVEQLSPVAQEVVRRLSHTDMVQVDQLFPEEMHARNEASSRVSALWQSLMQATSLQPPRR